VSLNEEGCLVINAPAVHDGPLVTNDIAELSPANCLLSSFNFQLSTQQLRILGRKDNVICSGGIKIQIEEVERLLHPHLHVPYMITKAPDQRLGEQVVLLTEAHDISTVQDICRQVLPKYWQPRKYLSVGHLPMTETGKPARAEAERLATR
jgi:O-succinylbenzoic acid--CoA ligase